MGRVQLVGQTFDTASQQGQDLFNSYLEYIGSSEAPMIFHRWSFLSILGAWLGRRYYFPFGHNKINCNMYVMLMGEAGSRKTTAINQATKILRTAGYENISGTKITKEKFLLKLSGADTTAPDEDILDANLFGPAAGEQEDREMFISAEEFNIFVGNGNIEFLALLGTLWDFEGPFTNEVKNSKSDVIWNPTVSMLAGNTATSFSLAFPPEAIGQGIFSRLLLIHGERTGVKITFPAPPNIELRNSIVSYLHEIRNDIQGAAQLSPEAHDLLDYIYKNYAGVSDVRYDSYNNRRFTHLIKLCLLISAMQKRTSILGNDVIMANTILAYAELMMPRALGEFGKSKQSDVNHKIITLINSSLVPKFTFGEIWKHVHNDLDSPDKLRELLNNLVLAGKLAKANISSGQLVWVCTSNLGVHGSDVVDWSLLTEEERKVIS